MRKLLGDARAGNAIALVALFVALGGTAFAAATITSRDVKNNSLTSSDIRNNSLRGGDIRNSSLTSSDVRNGSLLAADFKSGQLPAGAKGDKGDKGDIGPSDAFQALRNAISPPVLPAGATTTLVTLSLPAGRYVLFGKLGFDATVGPVTVTCRLVAGTDTDRALATAAGIGGYNCHMQTVHEFAAAGTATLEIETPVGSSVRAGDAKVTAIRVGTVTNTAVTG